MLNSSPISVQRGKSLGLIRRALKRYWVLYLLFVPIAAYFFIFDYMPMYGVLIAFKDYKLGSSILGSPWAANGGFKHFIRLFGNAEYLSALKNTLVLSAMRILLGFSAPILFALLLNEIKFDKYKRVLQTVSYLPHFISYVVVYGILYTFFSWDGPINAFRSSIGMEKYLYMGSKDAYRWLFTFSSIWKGLGWGSIIYLAALTRVNPELYEAADIDGASRLQKTWHITLNEIRPIISIQFVLTMGRLLSVSLEQTTIMMNDMVYDVANVISYFVYKKGLLSINQYSFATSSSLVNSILGLILVFGTNYLAKKIDEDGGLW